MSARPLRRVGCFVRQRRLGRSMVRAFPSARCLTRAFCLKRALRHRLLQSCAERDRVPRVPVWPLCVGAGREWLSSLHARHLFVARAVRLLRLLGRQLRGGKCNDHLRILARFAPWNESGSVQLSVSFAVLRARILRCLASPSASCARSAPSRLRCSPFHPTTPLNSTCRRLGPRRARRVRAPRSLRRLARSPARSARQTRPLSRPRCAPASPASAPTSPRSRASPSASRAQAAPLAQTSVFSFYSLSLSSSRFACRSALRRARSVRPCRPKTDTTA